MNLNLDLSENLDHDLDLNLKLDLDQSHSNLRQFNYKIKDLERLLQEGKNKIALLQKKLDEIEEKKNATLSSLSYTTITEI
uniref:Uncharacterized protein n=1 Tax=Wuchereria bancrofti TaxID=6293 RepID=A0A1I8EFE0_WUCBA